MNHINLQKQIEEAFSLSQFQYKFPKKDKERILFDFYAITALYGQLGADVPGVQHKVHGDTEVDDFIYDETLDTILTETSKELMDALIYSVSCEFRYIYQYRDGPELESYFKHLDDRVLDKYENYEPTEAELANPYYIQDKPLKSAEFFRKYHNAFKKFNQFFDEPRSIEGGTGDKEMPSTRSRLLKGAEKELLKVLK